MRNTPNNQPARIIGPPKDGLWDKFVPKILNKIFPNNVHPPGSKLEWKSSDGRKTKICNMATRHIINTIRLINRGDHKAHTDKGKFYDALMAELGWRKQMGQLNSPQADIPNILDDENDAEINESELSEGGIFFEHKS